MQTLGLSTYSYHHSKAIILAHPYQGQRVDSYVNELTKFKEAKLKLSQVNKRHPTSRRNILGTQLLYSNMQRQSRSGSVGAMSEFSFLSCEKFLVKGVSYDRSVLVPYFPWNAIRHNYRCKPKPVSDSPHRSNHALEPRKKQTRTQAHGFVWEVSVTHRRLTGAEESE